MIVIINGTNRPNSRTSTVAKHIQQLLEKNTNKEVHYLTLEALNGITISASLFDENQMDPSIREMQTKILIPSTQWVIVSPEYNGTFPGVLKFWIDLLSVHQRNETFKGKKISLVGVASGRAGNLRGMDQLSTFLHYLGAHIMPNKLPISMIHTNIDATTKELSPATASTLQAYVEEVIEFGK